MLAVFLSMLESSEEKRRFQEIYEENHLLLEKIAFYMLKDPHDAEDAVQNTFVQVIRHFYKTYDLPSEELPYWLISIVKNEARMLLRKRAKIVALEEGDEIEDSAEAVTSYWGLVDLFTKLPDTYRMVLEMKILYGYTDREIAKRLHLTETAVSSRASRGRALLRKIVEAGGYEA